MARSLNVEILADASQYERTLRRAARSTQQFNTGIKRQGLSLGKTFAASFGIGLGAAGLVRGLQTVIAEATEHATVQKQLEAQFRASGVALQDYQAQIDETVNRLSILAGVDDEEVLTSFTAVFRATKDVQLGLKITAIAADVAKGAHKDLGQTTLALTKVLGGQNTALRRMGILLPAGVTGMEAINFVAQKFAGQAAAGTTAQERFNIALKNMEEAIGTALLPTLNKLLGQMTEWLGKTENQKKVQDAVKQGAQVLGAALEALKTVFDRLNAITGSTKNTLKLLLAAFVAFKTAKLISMLTGIAGSIGLIGTKAQTSTGQVNTLGGALKGLGPLLLPFAAAGATVASTAGVSGSRAGPLKVSALNDLVTYQDPVDGKWRMVTKTRGETSEQAARRDFERRHPGAALPTKAGVDVSDRQPGRSPGGPAALTVPGGLRDRKRRASLAYQMSLLNLQLAKAELTASKLDDKAVLLRQAALLRRQIAATKDLKLRTEFYGQLKGINDQIQAIDEEAAQTAQTQRQKELDRREKAAEAAKRHAEKVRAAVAKQRAAEAAALIAGQFRALGFTGIGEERVPSARALRKQLGKLADSVKGTVLDTAATRSLLERIRKVLSGGLGNLGRDVRERIKQMIDEITAQLDQGEQKVRRRRPGFLDPGFGHGVNPTFGAGGIMAGGVRIDNLNLYGVQDVRGLENELLKRSTTRPQPRRGP